jgi:formate/nitrite transporter FocA (FNT family)
MMGLIGPVSSGYPGKYPFYGFVIFVACLYGAELVHFYKKRKNISKKVSTRSKEAILKEVSVGEILFLGVFCALLIGIALWNIYTHRPY